MGHPHTGKCNSTTPTPPSHHRNTLCTCTNPKVLNTPRFKETDPWQLRDRQWHTDAILRALRVHTAGQGETHKYTEMQRQEHNGTCLCRGSQMQKCSLMCKPKHTPSHTHHCTRAPQGAAITARVVCKSNWQGDTHSLADSHPASPPKGQSLEAEGSQSFKVDSPTSHSPVVRLFRRNSICSVCPACSARARGVGASESPEKQWTPAPQPRSAWVSARSVVVTAAHRAWGRGEEEEGCPKLE